MQNHQHDPTLAQLKILLVEDQAEVRAYVRDSLYDMGVSEVLEARDGRTALKIMDSSYTHINLIICDWNMPRITGIQFLRQVRSVFTKMPFLMVTGRTDQASANEAGQAGVTDFIRKPFTPMQLEDKLKYFVEAAITMSLPDLLRDLQDSP